MVSSGMVGIVVCDVRGVVQWCTGMQHSNITKIVVAVHMPVCCYELKYGGLWCHGDVGKSMLLWNGVTSTGVIVAECGWCIMRH